MSHTKAPRAVLSLLVMIVLLLAACSPTAPAPAATTAPTTSAQTTPTKAAGTTPTSAAATTPSAAAAGTPTGGAAGTPTTGAAGTPTGGAAGTTPTSGAAGTPTAGAGTTPTAGTSQIPADQLASDQTLHLATTDPDNIDPQQASFVTEISFIMRVYEGLMTFNDQLTPVPGAAEKYDVSSDGKTYTFTLRQGLKYSDGQPLTAANFEYAWKRLCDPSLAGEYAFTGYVIVGCEEYNTADPKKLSAQELQALRDKVGVKATGDNTLQISLKDPAPYFLSIAALWVGVPTREDLVKAGGDSWTTDPTGKYYIGNGPYKMTVFQPKQHYAFVPNPNYRLGAPKVGFDLRVINDSAVQFAAYKNGELDAYGVAPEDLQSIQNDPTLSKELVRNPGTCTFYIGFNTQKAPFDNVKVRQAFAQAFDRKSYIQNILKGLGSVAYSFIPPGQPGYDPSIKQWEFNADAAKKALADAGFPDGKGLPDITMTFSSSPRNQTRFEFLQAQFKDNLGINVKLDPVDPKTYTSLVKKPETTPQLFFLGWCQDYPDPQDWLTTVFDSRSTVTHVGWKNDEFDKLVRQADIEPDRTKRFQLYKQAQQILVQEAPVAFFYYDEADTLVKPYVANVNLNSAAQYFSQFTIMNVAIKKH